MTDQAPVLRTCGFCRGTGERNDLDCMACHGSGLVWVPVPDAGFSDSDDDSLPRNQQEQP